MDHTVWILLPSVALVYFVYRWELEVSAYRTKGYSIPLWLDAVGIVGLVIVQVGIAGPLRTDVPWFAPLWLSISVSGLLLLIVAAIAVRRKVTRQATQIPQRVPSAIRAPELSEAEKRRLTALKRRSSVISIVAAIVFLLCCGIGFGTLDLMREDTPVLNVGLIFGGSLLLLIALVWTALLHCHIRRIEGNKKQEAGLCWWE